MRGLWVVLALGCGVPADKSPELPEVDPDVVVDTDCPQGFFGDDCADCTWQSAGEACMPAERPQIYDLDALTGLSLEELEWVETSRRTERGVRVLVGTWSGGSFEAVNAEGELETIELLERAAIYLPPGEPEDAPNKGLVVGVHFAEDVDDPLGIEIARSFGIPVLFHGQERENWLSLGFESRGDMTKASAPVVHERNPCHLVDPTTGNFRYHTTRTHLRGTTLLQRVVASFGGEVETIALRGYSKEGSAVWLASIYDPRIEVASPGGSKLPAARLGRPAWWESYGCDPDDDLGQRAISSWENFSWSTTTPAGASMMARVDVLLNADRLQPRVFLMDGDHGATEQHDGIAGMPPAADTPFLERFDAPWRYVRKWEAYAGVGDGGDEVSKRLMPILAVELLLEGPGSETRLYPKVSDAVASLDGDVLRVDAAVTEGTPERVALWWSWSEDRIWADVEQMPWAEVEMELTDGRWVAPEVTVPSGGVVGWYVEAQNEGQVGESVFARRDSSPMRFARTTPALTCDVAPIEWCER